MGGSASVSRRRGRDRDRGDRATSPLPTAAGGSARRRRVDLGTRRLRLIERGSAIADPLYDALTSTRSADQPRGRRAHDRARDSPTRASRARARSGRAQASAARDAPSYACAHSPAAARLGSRAPTRSIDWGRRTGRHGSCGTTVVLRSPSGPRSVLAEPTVDRSARFRAGLSNGARRHGGRSPPISRPQCSGNRPAWRPDLVAAHLAMNVAGLLDSGHPRGRARPAAWRTAIVLAASGLGTIVGIIVYGHLQVLGASGRRGCGWRDARLRTPSRRRDARLPATAPAPLPGRAGAAVRHRPGSRHGRRAGAHPAVSPEDAWRSASRSRRAHGQGVPSAVRSRPGGVPRSRSGFGAQPSGHDGRNSSATPHDSTTPRMPYPRPHNVPPRAAGRTAAPEQGPRRARRPRRVKSTGRHPASA